MSDKPSLADDFATRLAADLNIKNSAKCPIRMTAKIDKERENRWGVFTMELETHSLQTIIGTFSGSNAVRAPFVTRLMLLESPNQVPARHG